MWSSRTLTTCFALGRIVFGTGLVAAPERVARGWIGDDASRPAMKVAIRGLGARDIALSAGMLLVGGGGRKRPWLLAATACDCVDLTATLAAGDALAERARIGTVLLAGGSVLAGAALARAAGGAR
jgi:hypothetical protein